MKSNRCTCSPISHIAPYPFLCHTLLLPLKLKIEVIFKNKKIYIYFASYFCTFHWRTLLWALSKMTTNTIHFRLSSYTIYREINKNRCTTFCVCYTNRFISQIPFHSHWFAPFGYVFKVEAVAKHVLIVLECFGFCLIFIRKPNV